MRKKDIFEENKELQSSLFLAQSYQDAWADYGRSLKKERFEKVIREGGTLKDKKTLSRVSGKRKKKYHP